MKKKLSRRATLLLALLFTIGLIIYGCKKSGNDSKSATAIYSGKELFTGLVLRQGSVASKIPLVNEAKIDWSEAPDEVRANGVKFTNDILKEISKSNPSFFANFQEKIQSGDPVQIRSAINAGAAEFYSAINKFPTYAESLNEGRKLISQVDISKITNAHGILDRKKLQEEFDKLPAAQLKTNSVISPNCCTLAWFCVVWVVAGVDAAVVSNVAGAIAGYLYLALYGPALESPSAAAATQNSLMSDMLVNQIAENLSN